MSGCLLTLLEFNVAMWTVDKLCAAPFVAACCPRGAVHEDGERLLYASFQRINWDQWTCQLTRKYSCAEKIDLAVGNEGKLEGARHYKFYISESHQKYSRVPSLIQQ